VVGGDVEAGLPGKFARDVGRVDVEFKPFVFKFPNILGDTRKASGVG